MSMPSRFCSSCGAQLPPTASFCASCGERIAGTPDTQVPQHVAAHPATHHAAAPHAGPTPWADQPWPRRGGRTGLVVGAALAVLVAGGGGFAAVKLLGGGGGNLVDGSKLASAVGSEPEEAWTYDTDGEYAMVAASGDTTIVGLSDSGEIVALGRDGDELWRAGGDDDYYGYGYVLPDSDLVLVQGYEDYGVGVLSLDDGEELWFDESGGSAVGLVGGSLLLSTSDEDDLTSEISVLDPGTGETQWSVSDVDSSAVTQDSVFVIADGELRRLSSSGDEEWSVSLEVGDEEYPSVSAVEGMVAVSAGEVTAYSTDDGEQLWTEGGSEDASIYASRFTGEMLYLDESVYNGDNTEQTITVFDREGERGELDIDEEEPFYGYGFEAGGTSYFLNTGDPSLYDEELERLDTYDGEVVAVDEGVYNLDDDKLRFYTFEDSSAVWEIDVDSSDDSASIYAGDGVVYTLVDAQLTAYR